MVLAPHDELGYGRTKVRIEFDTLALQPRDFTIRILPKVKRSLVGPPHYHLQNLKGSLRKIEETLRLFFTLADSASKTHIPQQHIHLLDPMITEVVQVIKNLRNSKNSF